MPLWLSLAIVLVTISGYVTSYGQMDSSDSFINDPTSETPSNLDENIIDPDQSDNQNGAFACLYLIVNDPSFTRIENSLVEVNYTIDLVSCSASNQVMTLDVKPSDKIIPHFDYSSFQIMPYDYNEVNLTFIIPNDTLEKHLFEIEAKISLEDNNEIYNINHNTIEFSSESPILVITSSNTYLSIEEEVTFHVDPFFVPQETTSIYEWNFGDGTPSIKGQDVSHTYNTSGLYDVTLTSINSATQKSQVETLQIEVPDPYSEWTHNYLKFLMDNDSYDQILLEFVIPIILAPLALYYLSRKPITDEKDYPKFYLERIFER